MMILTVGHTAIFGPAATTWFQFLQHKIVLQNKTLETVARVAADQTLFAPTNLCVFLSTMAVMEGSSPKEKLEQKQQRDTGQHFRRH